MASIHTFALWALATVTLVSTPNLTASASFAALAMASEEGDVGTMTVPQHITVGSEIQIQVADPSRAGQTVMVTIASDDDETEKAVVEVRLDADGNGSASWTVPAWDQAFFNCPGIPAIYSLIY